MAHRVHFPDISGHETGYGISWCTCRVCNRDFPVGQLTMTAEGPVCDSDYESYEWTRYGADADDRPVTP